MASSSGTKDDMGPPRTLSRGMTRMPKRIVDLPNEDNTVNDSELVPSSLASIAPILRVANEIQKDNPRVAYLCRFHAFERAHMVDPTSGHGVRQFKTYLMHRLEKEEVEAVHVLARDDSKEILLFYDLFYEKNIKEGEYTKKPEEMAKICQIATVLYEVLKTVVPSNQIDPQTKRIADDVHKKRVQYADYNILPLYGAGVKPAIMELPEIKATINALHNLKNLPMPRMQFRPLEPDEGMTITTERTKPINDIFDWLSSIFGFQKGSVANQREHLTLLLANDGIRNKRNLLDDKQLEATVKHFEDKIFENYKTWCNFLHRESNCRMPQDSNELQLKLIYIALYLLIWGEASNIRLMPECLCYIFHNMAKEVYVIIHTNVHPVSGEAYDNEARARDEEHFLRNVITPIYDALHKEARKSRGNKASNSRWRNYEDINEYFWSEKCFSLGWPMNPKSDFLGYSDRIQTANKRVNQATKERRQPKTNFVEFHTFWHLYRNFNRMWIFFTLAFQAMVIVAWNSRSGSLSALFDEDGFRNVLSIFITFASLKFLRATVDIVLSLKAWKSLRITQIVRYLLKISVAAFWVVVMAMGYYCNLLVVAIYLVPNMLALILFLLPPNLRRTMDTSNLWILILIQWWAHEPQLYIGRCMHEDIITKLKYTLFWIMLLMSKLAFNYYVEILPLVRSTKRIIEMSIDNYQWHEFFPNVTSNIPVIVAIWAPIVLVYFMDAQIWYFIFSAVFGLINGAFSRLHQIRKAEMLHSKFKYIPSAFSHRLIPTENKGAKRKDSVSLVWNEFINSMREEDLISNRDRDLLLIPCCSEVASVQWPLFLLLNKISIAIELVKDFKGTKEDELFRKIKSDDYMYSAVMECYETLQDLICDLLTNEADKMFVRQIYKEVDESVKGKRTLETFQMSELPSLIKRLKEFFDILIADDEKIENLQPRIINALQNTMKVITHDFMSNGYEILKTVHQQNRDIPNVKEEEWFSNVNIEMIRNKSWMKKIRRLHLLLTVKEISTQVPRNLEARRRITFFANSLFMNMPSAPKVRDMLSFSVLTPYSKEDVLYTSEELNMENEDGISILFYLKKLYPDEWRNFIERINDPKLGYPERDKSRLICEWVSYRGQTLYRTVRGMMYYRQALELQCFLDLMGDNNGGYSESSKKDIQVLADLKFTYVVSCQVYGDMKKSYVARDQSCYTNILRLMLTYPSLRVAYIDTRLDSVNGVPQEVYYSVLVKGGDRLDEEIYRIKLPGNPGEIGEGKFENQNNAIIFTRGEALQTIDMNQDNYFEEAFKMRNVLEEFLKPRRGQQKPTILGLREHIFMSSVSSLSEFISNQENSFGTIGQRTLADPLRVRFHYGHSDIFDKIFHTTRGGISKASRNINLNGEIFAGFNSTLRGGLITHHEYVQVGKGRDASINQISLFEAKVASGNGEQTLSRDVYRLGRQFDFYRMLSFYFTTAGYYCSSMIAVLSVYMILYGRLYMVMSGVEKEFLKNTIIHQNKALEETLAAQSIIQMSLFFMLPMAMEIALEKSFRRALVDFIAMHLQLASVFFTFQLGTRAHYYGRALLHGDFRYRAVGCSFVPYRARLAENYRLYSRSHFVKGLELFILLLVCEIYGESPCGSNRLYFVISSFSIWFLVACWLFAPFLFNPCGLDWHRIVDDLADWESWMENRSHIGMLPEESWESWWNGEYEHLKFTNIRGRLLEILLAFRFFIYQYGIVYHLDMAYRSNSLMVYGLSWVFIIAAFLFLEMLLMSKRKFGRLMFRILNLMLFLSVVLSMTVLFVVYGLTISDAFAAILAFLPTGWALLLIGQANKALLERFGFWESITELAKAYDYVMGLVIFIPIATVSRFPIVSKLQMHLLFYEAFRRGIKVSEIFPSKKR